jgi:8-oxo-dGTP pyrophosphatase MutT (NUDIX family)
VRTRRSSSSWPGRLDVTVGGGISAADTPLSTILKEAAEEACLDADYVSEHIRSVGVLPFPNRSPAGWLLPGLYYLYELELPPDRSIYPRPNVNDGEVDTFEEMDASAVLRCLLNNEFKSSSALAMVHFFIRHGYITAETEPRFVQVCKGLTTDIGLPVPWRPV